MAIIERKGEIAFEGGEPYAHCNDRPLSGTTIRYRPARGYVGDDTFVFPMAASAHEAGEPIVTRGFVIPQELIQCLQC